MPNGISHFVIIAISWVLSRVCGCAGAWRAFEVYVCMLPNKAGLTLGSALAGRAAAGARGAGARFLRARPAAALLPCAPRRGAASTRQVLSHSARMTWTHDMAQHGS